MKIKTQFIITVALFLIILLVLAVSVAVTTKKLLFYNQQEDITGNIERSARELSYISTVTFFMAKASSAPAGNPYRPLWPLNFPGCDRTPLSNRP